MKYLFPLVGLVLPASALSISRQTSPNTTCSFVLTAIGSPSGPVLIDTIGENRLGGGFSQGSYYMSGHTLFDSLNHNCLIDPTTQQFECIQGGDATTVFELGDDGNLVHDGCENWLACPATGPGNDGSWNIFGDAKSDTTGCEMIQLRTGGFCSALGRPSSSSAGPTPTPTPTTVAQSSSISVQAASATSAPAASCPTNINAGTYISPSQLILTSPPAPNTAFGASTKAYISPLNTTLYNFAIPSSPAYTGSCALIFLFPFASDLSSATSAYYFSGLEQELGENGGLGFALLNGAADTSTTFANTPDVVKDYGKIQIVSGNNYTIGTFPCGAQQGEVIAVKGSSVNDTELDYTQGDKPSAVGLYIVPCL